MLASDAILATNTSSLSVGAIAEGLPHPERVVGLHFFNPVKRMPLVEIVRGPQTSRRDRRALRGAGARARQDAGRRRRTSPASSSTACSVRTSTSACACSRAASSPRASSALLDGFGMPMGPLELLDEVGLDIASHAAPRCTRPTARA